MTVACSTCGGPLAALSKDASVTTVGYRIGACGKPHDNNCIVRVGVCAKGHATRVRLRRKCNDGQFWADETIGEPACDWLGMDVPCCAQVVVDEWPILPVLS